MSSEPTVTDAEPSTQRSRRRERITPRVVVAAIALSIATQVVTSGVALRLSGDARRTNCENTHDAIQGAFQKLGERLGADQAEIDAFLVELDPITSDCS